MLIILKVIIKEFSQSYHENELTITVLIIMSKFKHALLPGVNPGTFKNWRGGGEGGGYCNRIFSAPPPGSRL